jgi:hypothetical protein
MSRTGTVLLAAAVLVLVVIIVLSRRPPESSALPIEGPSGAAVPRAETAPAPTTPASPATAGPINPLATPETREADDAAVDQFKKDIDAYAELHKRVEKAQPKLSNNASIQEIDRHQRAMLQALATARPEARRGDIFKPAMEQAVRRMLIRVFEGVEGRQQRDSIMDENPAGIHVKVNSRYPDEVPLASMPPDVLAALPKMPEELEYRFIGEALAIMDVHAHLVVDYIPNALPRN